MSEKLRDFGGFWEQLKDLPFLRSPQGWKILLLLGIGIFLMVSAGSLMENNPPETQSRNSGRGFEQEGKLSKIEQELAQRLEEVLGAVSGAGRVEVIVTLASGPEQVFAQNVSKEERTVEEKDQVGGIRTTTEVTERGDLVLLQEGSGKEETPVIIKEARPEIAGVLILAEGAKNPQLKEKLVRAVVTVLAIPPHKVTILPREGR
ncbi:MAG: Stage III sporulation protein AG [Thermoanaerobacterales bacterium 50_218]|nr:MAG: Stage III sporulation protein AG [Thermoanaerobacterales bacterium 50_218]HAA89376.1 stage III sporulation protein AG [Peptococcaceae bacterium]